MGDHRASVKITFEAHGITRTADMNINWVPEYDGIDDRVREFFQRAWDECLAVYEPPDSTTELAVRASDIAWLEALQYDYKSETVRGMISRLLIAASYCTRRPQGGGT